MMCNVLNMNVCVAGINNACVAMHTYINTYIHTYIHTWRANNQGLRQNCILSCFTEG